MDPKLFKRLARAYITGTDISNVELSDTTKNLANTIYSIEKIEKKYAISSSDTVRSALVKTTQASATATPAPKPAEALTEAQVIDKIKGYGMRFGTTDFSKYVKVEVIRSNDSYTATYSAINIDGIFEAMKSADPEMNLPFNPISKLNPLTANFDKTGKLLDQQITIN